MSEVKKKEPNLIKRYIQENLTIEVYEETSYDYSDTKYINVKLLLEGETISEDRITV